MLDHNPFQLTFNSEARNSVLTPGGMGELVGHRLKVDPADDAQGVFFVTEDGAETKVAVLGRNKPANLMFLVPDSLTAGNYTLEVRAKIYSGEDLRVGALEVPLVVS